jgi:hypothetical protein
MKKTFIGILVAFALALFGCDNGSVNHNSGSNGDNGSGLSNGNDNNQIKENILWEEVLGAWDNSLGSYNGVPYLWEIRSWNSSKPERDVCVYRHELVFELDEEIDRYIIKYSKSTQSSNYKTTEVHENLLYDGEKFTSDDDLNIEFRISILNGVPDMFNVKTLKSSHLSDVPFFKK